MEFFIRVLIFIVGMFVGVLITEYSEAQAKLKMYEQMEKEEFERRNNEKI